MAASTVATYLKALHQLDAFLRQQGMPTDVAAIRREHIEAFLVALHDSGHRPATVANRYRSLQQVFRWLVGEDEIADSPMARMRPPTVPDEPPPVLRVEELERLLAACAGTSFEDRRDTAVIRLLASTGMRRGAAGRDPPLCLRQPLEGNNRVLGVRDAVPGWVAWVAQLRTGSEVAALFRAHLLPHRLNVIGESEEARHIASVLIQATAGGNSCFYDDRAEERWDWHREALAMYLDGNHSSSFQCLATTDCLKRLTWWRSDDVGPRPEVVRSKHIHDVRSTDEAVGEAVSRLFRDEAGLLKTDRRVPGRLSHRTHVDKGVNVDRRPGYRHPVLAFQNRHHQTANQHPSPIGEQARDFGGCSPQLRLSVAAGGDAYGLPHRS